MWLLNALSLNMLPEEGGAVVYAPVALEVVQELAREGALQSAIGHADTARVLSGILGVPVEANRVSVKLAPFDKAVVAQYVGPRLPEGATTLPEGATMRFYLVEVRP